MFVNLNFNFDGQDSIYKGLAVVRTGESGLIELPFGITQAPIEEKLKSIDEPFFYGIERSPITFPLTFAILDESIKWNDEKRLDIVNWLFQSDYKPFISEDHPDIEYYIMAVSDSKFFTNGIEQGYVTISFRMMTPFAYTVTQYDGTPYEITQTDNIIELENLSNIRDYYYYPIFEFTLTGDSTDVTFRNLSDGGRELTFAGLNQGETIYIDNKRCEVISDTGLPRISKCNRKWFRLTTGVNRVMVVTNGTGGANLTVEMKFPINF